LAQDGGGGAAEQGVVVGVVQEVGEGADGGDAGIGEDEFEPLGGEGTGGGEEGGVGVGGEGFGEVGDGGVVLAGDVKERLVAAEEVGKKIAVGREGVMRGGGAVETVGGEHGVSIRQMIGISSRLIAIC
jgi:hypothetical protein